MIPLRPRIAAKRKIDGRCHEHLLLLAPMVDVDAPWTAQFAGSLDKARRPARGLRTMRHVAAMKVWLERGSRLIQFIDRSHAGFSFAGPRLSRAHLTERLARLAAWHPLYRT